MSTSLRTATMAHCKRELFHAAWEPLLDDAFVDGIVIDCADGVKRRMFPIIFTYSTDYPEKYLDSVLSASHILTCRL